MKKHWVLLWNQLSFLFLAFLTALVVIVLGINLLNSIKEFTQFSITPTLQNSDSPVTILPDKTEGNLPLLPPVTSQKQFNYEGNHKQFPQPSQKQLNSEEEPQQFPQPSQKQLNSEEEHQQFPQPSQKQFNSEEEHQQFPQPSNTPPKVETYLGHFPYSENKQQNLVKVADFYGREEFLDKAAANAFNRMKSEAKASGVDLTIISGFRSLAQQDKLFTKQINKRRSKEEAARFSAPPGYSEHHTGYALDIGEGQNIETYIKFEFEYTEAYRWLVRNAYKYGFELSFPKNNLQGVSYEPWHWRFVGSPDAIKVFAHTKSHT